MICPTLLGSSAIPRASSWSAYVMENAARFRAIGPRVWGGGAPRCGRVYEVSRLNVSMSF